VEELSGGAVKFDKFPGEILVKGGDIYEACRDGIIQAGNFLIPYEAGQIPLPTIKELPFSFINFDTNYLMWRKFMEIGLDDYLHSYGIQVVSDMTLTPYGFWTSKKWGPIKRLEDVKGCKVRSPGGYMSKALETMGAIPISMPSPEAYTAMDRGTLDCISMVESSQIAFRLHEVTKYITRADYGTTGVPIMVNLKTWNSLPKDIQKIMLQAGREAEVNVVKEMLRYQKEVVDPTVLKSGIEIIPLPEKERERMKKACAPVWDEWLAKNGPIFNGLGKKMFDIVVENVGR
jgi:TRAP-type C4-dicarboxylate transport system substrate-binding protein